MIKEIKNYEGVCRYCGELQPVMAGSQEEADILVSEKCDCAGAEYAKRLSAMQKNAALIVTDKNDNIISLLQTAGELIIKGVIGEIQIKSGNIKYKVASNNKGQVKFTRTESRQQELQD